MVRLAFVLVAVIGLAGCGDDPLPCVDNLDTQCAPLYPPTFANVFANTLSPTCAQTGASCHAREGAQGGLVFEDATESYNLLLGLADGNARVIPHDPACSTLIKRIETTQRQRQLPPGQALSPAERCALVRWVNEGALQ